jgi:hypothetical protein
MPAYDEADYNFLVWYVGQPFVDESRPQDIADLARVARAMAAEKSLQNLKSRARHRATWETVKGPWKPPRW